MNCPSEDPGPRHGIFYNPYNSGLCKKFGHVREKNGWIPVIVFLSYRYQVKKSRIRETSNLSTDADRRTDTILERLRDLSKKK